MLGTALTLLALAAATPITQASPTPAQVSAAQRGACDDARRLLRAGLLQDADAELVRIDPRRGTTMCTLVPDAMVYMGRAARFAEKAKPYWRAMELKRVPRDSDAHDRALRRAATWLIRSLTLNPFDAESRSALTQIIGALAAPRSRDEANALCATANLVRIAGLLEDADVIYAKALRSGHNTTCLLSGLGQMRADAAKAQRYLLAAGTEEGAGDKPAARIAYLNALDVDASLTQARAAVHRLPPPDPKPRVVKPAPPQRSLLVRDGDWLVHRGSSVVDWVAKNLTLTIVAAIAVLVILRILSALALLAARIPPFRWAMDFIAPLRRYTRTTTIVKPFTPEVEGSSPTAVFSEFLTMPPIKPSGSHASDTASVDRFEAAEQTSAVSFATVLAEVPNAGPLAAALTWYRTSAPRRLANFEGELLKGDVALFGLRLVVRIRGGRAKSATFWSSSLPGPPFGPDDAVRAQLALSILAAAWAHEVVK